MGWTAPTTRATDFLVTAAIWNAEHVDNFNTAAMHLIARASSDQALSTTTMTNDPTLVATVGANEVWMFEYNLWIATTNGFYKYGFSFPSGEVGAAFGGIDNIYIAGGSSSPTADSNAVSINNSFPTIGQPYILRAMFACGGTGGTFQMRWALSTATGSTTRRSNSTLWGVKLA